MSNPEMLQEREGSGMEPAQTNHGLRPEGSALRPVEEAQGQPAVPRLEIIPLGKIMPHPENPRGPVEPAEAQAMEDSLRESGQKPPSSFVP